MTTACTEPTVVVRRRPKDRKAQIARVAAESFSALGYHAVSMEAIAAKVGISAPALYRHYASKYDLFRGAVLALGQQLVDCTDFGEAESAGADPAATLDRLVDALIDVTLANRESGGLYRWQARYLHGEDQSTLMDQLRVANRRIQRPLMVIRPTLTSSHRWMLSSGLLSVIGSIVDHRVALPSDEISALLADVASA
ncbi:MAG: helix-turn-helix domain-containing protein, partial [Mycobacterium sp.]|uniref:TetR/AcrR family transcriptional regulator n=1 Tax=Mycobacterium sp. TaxID=1785 RepID=UPI003BAFC728